MNSERILLTRRSAIVSGFWAAVPCILPLGGFAFSEETGQLSAQLSARLAAIETRSGGRLGCATLDTSNGRRVLHRAGERFPMCSTFKVTATAFVLHRAEKGQEHLDRRVSFSSRDLVAHSPITEKHVDEKGMTISELCEAAMTISDNTAANLLLASFGGPAALTAFLRSIGDEVTRLDRIETSLNDAVPGDPRDTTTPSAMLENLHNLILGNILSPASRELLVNWMKGCQTGRAKLRAGLPADWKAGDKTGGGDHGTSNDIAVIWPPNRKPVFITAYLTQATTSDEASSALLAEVGRAFAMTLK